MGLALPTQGEALSIPKRPLGYVHDTAALISPSTESSLAAQLQQFENETSNQLVVATFPSLEGEVLEDFSMRVAETWKVGQKDKDNGVLLLIFKKDRAVRIEVGYGLEGALTDATAKLIIENEILVPFKNGRFDQGVQNGVNAIIAATKNEYTVPPKNILKDKENVEALLGWGFLFALLFPKVILRFFFVIGIVVLGSSLFTKSLTAGASAFFLGILPLPISLLIKKFDVSGTSIRGGSRGGWRSSGGGFSGGGGSFGGGGASGRW